MKALTLSQPWATLVADNLKCYETRSWRPGMLGPIAIHAAKTIPPQGRKMLADHAFRHVTFGDEPVPTGVVLAVVTIEEVTRITADNAPSDFLERAYGDYTPGRYMWRLGRPTALAEPIPVRGALGIWEWKPKCQEPGCDHDGSLCQLYDSENDVDLGWFYCAGHATDNGFCFCCGQFFAGTSEHDRWFGSNGLFLCDNCKGDFADAEQDLYDEDMDLWEHYPGELIVGNADYGKVKEEPCES